MAKTSWADGTYLTPAQMILFFGNNAATGHDHDGTDDDGSCPKINTAGTISAEVRNTYYTTQADFTMYYEKIYNMVCLRFPYQVASHGSSTELQIHPDTTWPAAILAAASEELHIPLIVISNSVQLMGSILIPDGSTEEMVLYCPNSTGELSAGNFNATNKGFRRQSIFYETTDET